MLLLFSFTNTNDSHKPFFLVEKTYKKAMAWGIKLINPCT